MDGAKSFADSYSNAMGNTSKITKESIKQPFEVISQMVSKVNELSELLANDKIMKIDIAPKLENLAQSVGLGGKGSFSISHKPINLNVSFDVRIDAKQLEYAIVDRNGLGKDVVINYDKEKRSRNI